MMSRRRPAALPLALALGAMAGLGACFPSFDDLECYQGKPCPAPEGPCEEVACVKKRCVVTPVAGACDDPRPCVVATCDAATGECLRDTTACACDEDRACSAADPCAATLACDLDTYTCVERPAPADGSLCDDGDACTSGDRCHLGACSGAPVVCAAPGPCERAGSCDPTRGACTYPPAPRDSPCAAGFCRDGECRDRQVAAGSQHACALIHGAVRCWGANGSGALGNGWPGLLGDDEPASGGGPTPIAGEVVRLAAAIAHTCALLRGGVVTCWGGNSRGQLGRGGKSAVEAVPGTVGVLGAEVIGLAAGGRATCAVRRDGSVACWGSILGGVGDLVPADASVESVAPVTDIVLGREHGCAITGGGAVGCWGECARSGVCGVPGQRAASLEIGGGGLVALPGRVVELAAGAWHTCARLADGRVFCWGENARGQLGLGDREPIGVDVAPGDAGPVALGEPAIALGAGGEHTCAVTDSGATLCWGRATEGQVGVAPSGDGDHLRPVVVAAGGAGRALDGGDTFTCAVSAAGDLRCWGDGPLLGYGDGVTRGIASDTMPPPPLPLE